jgi:hypothetical protein
MNKVSAINALQGLLSLFLLYVYFAGGRVTFIITLFILFLISLLSISYNISRRRRWAEIAEAIIYVIFFAFSFMGVDNLKSLPHSEPVSNYFWIPCVAGILFNLGEVIGKIAIWFSRPK